MRTRTTRKGILTAAVGLAALAGAVAVAPAPAGAAAASADLGVTLTQHPNSVEASTTTVTYTATVTNAGPDSATKVVLIDPLSEISGRVMDMKTTAGLCESSQSFVTCRIGTLAPSATATITVSAQMRQAGAIDNTVTVTAAADDPNQDNNSATVTTVVTPGPTFEEAVITGYYNKLLGRKPTTAELQADTEVFKAGFVPAFLPRLTHTNTYRGRWVDRQFRTFLGRPAGNGTNYYVNWLAKGRTYEQVTASIVSSKEFMNRGSGSWVARAYKALTGDTIDPAQLGPLEDQLKRGGSRYAIAHGIATGEEAHRKFVDRSVRVFLNRPASRFELYVNVSDLQKGVRADVVEDQIFSSYDFWQTFTQNYAGSGVLIGPFGYYE